MASQQEVDYLNDRIRPRAEQLRALQALIRDDLEQWAQLGMATGGEDVADGGKPFTRDDCHVFKSRLAALGDMLAIAGAMGVMHKACVRPLRVTLER